MSGFSNPCAVTKALSTVEVVTKDLSTIQSVTQRIFTEAVD
jgi:hypothetical protein